MITGTGLEQDIYLYEADLAFNNPRMVEYYYSVITIGTSKVF